MKKLFLFATVAAAGLFAGCSSSDDAISDAGTVIENPDGPQAIKIGLANPVSIDATRGTGTVGGTKTGTADAVGNTWYGQSINVFMFNQIGATDPTLTLAVETPGTNPVYYYNDQKMITPGSEENKIFDMSTPASSGQAMIDDGTVKYYPTYGNFDFFGYHADDALTAGVTGTASDATWTVPFTIDGSQDLMSTKAILTDDQKTTMDAATNHTTDYYSAYSARKAVQPTLTFKHLLSRLQFKIKAGSASAAGWGKKYVANNYVAKDEISVAAYTSFNGTSAAGNIDKATLWEPSPAVDPTKYVRVNAAPLVNAANYDGLSAADKALDLFLVDSESATDGEDATRAVKVKAISVKSKTTGKLLVAWTEANTTMTDYKKIVWDADPKVTWLTLKERPYAVKTEANSTLDENDYVGGTAPAALTALNDKKTALTARQTTLADLTNPTAAETAELGVVTNELAAVNKDIANFWKTISEETYNSLVTTTDLGQNKFTKLTDNEKFNAGLVTLTPKAVTGTTPNYATDEITSVAEQIGDAIIMAPNDPDDNDVAADHDPTAELTMEVTVSQKVPTNWITGAFEEKEQSYELTIPRPKLTSDGSDDWFRLNHSYNVTLTVYGLERIRVMTTITPWLNGEDRQVGGDDDDDWTPNNSTGDGDPTPATPEP